MLGSGKNQDFFKFNKDKIVQTLETANPQDKETQKKLKSLRQKYENILDLQKSGSSTKLTNLLSSFIHQYDSFKHKNPYDILHEEGHEGNFTKQYKSRKSELKHLGMKEFAQYILQHPHEFKEITRKRAQYYMNFLIKRRPKNVVLIDEEPSKVKPKRKPKFVFNDNDRLLFVDHPKASPLMMPQFSSKPQRPRGIPFEAHFEPPIPKSKVTSKSKHGPMTLAKLKKLQKRATQLTKEKAKIGISEIGKLVKEAKMATEDRKLQIKQQVALLKSKMDLIDKELNEIYAIEGYEEPEYEEYEGGMRGGGIQDILRWIYDYTQPPMSTDEFFQRARERRITDAEAKALKDELLADRRLLQAHEAYLKAERENRNKKEAIAKLREQQIRSAQEYGVWEMPDQEFQEARDRYNRLAEESAQIQAEDADWEAVEDPQFWTSWQGRGRCHRTHRLMGGKLTAKEFQTMLKASYKPSSERENIGDYILDSSLSTDEVAVYHNPKTGDTKVVYRGTKGLRDWGNNLALVMGQYNKTDRYNRAKKIYEDVEKKYGTHQLDVLGHSQGAHLAKELGKNAKSVITLNEAVHPFYNNEHPNQTHVRSSSDIISGLNYLNPYNWGKKYITIPSENINPREEHRPAILDRLPENIILGNGRKFCK